MTGYAITNGKKYLNHPADDTLTTNINEAYLWKTAEKAMQKTRYVNQKKIFGESVFKAVWTEIEEAQIAAVPAAEPEDETTSFDSTPLDDSEIFVVPSGEEAFKVLIAFVPGIDRRLRLLKREESRIDREATDYMHFIEFSSLNAANGFAVVKELKELRLRRRKIKDEILYLQSLKTVFTEDAEAVLKELEKETVNRIYFPRVRPDLFDGSWMESHKAKRKKNEIPEKEALEAEGSAEQETVHQENGSATEVWKEEPDGMETAAIMAALAGIDLMCS